MVSLKLFYSTQMLYQQRGGIAQALKADGLRSNPVSATFSLCDFGQVPQPLCISVSSTAKWE